MLDPIEGLIEERRPRGDYFSVMRRNLATLRSSRMSVAIELDGVGFGYRPEQPVLEDVDLRVEEGEFVVRRRAERRRQDDPPPAPPAGAAGGGRVLLYGEPAHSSAAGGCSATSPSGPIRAGGLATVRELVTAGRLPATRLWGLLRAADRAAAVSEAIARVGLADRAETPLRTLSEACSSGRSSLRRSPRGRRCSSGRADNRGGRGLQESLAAPLDELHRELGVTILYVSHEFGAVERFVQRLVLVRGGVVFDGLPDSLGYLARPSHVHA